MRKKGSLQLSINAIVVLILAITLLGLGLGFIKNMFSSTSAQFDVTNQQLKSDILATLEESGELLTLKQAEFEVKSGSPQEFYFGLRNTDTAEHCFYVQFFCEEALGDPDKCDNNVMNKWAWFSTYDAINVEQGKSEAIYAKLQPTGSSETYMGKLYVWKSQNSMCETVNFESSAPNNATVNYQDQSGNVLSLYDSKEFYIKVI